MEKAGNYLLGEADKDVPKDTGALSQSGKVSKEDSSVFVSYDTPYAVKQHEELGYNHPNGGKAKYLEDPFNREKQTMIEIIAKEAGKNL